MRPVRCNQDQYPSVPSGAIATGHRIRRGARQDMIANGTITKVPADRVNPAAKAHIAANAQRSFRAQTMHQTIKATARASVYPAKKKKLAGHTAANITVRNG